MAVTINGNNGAVYQPDVMTLGNIVDADQTVTNSATLVTVPQLTIPVGANERVFFRYTVYYTSTATGDLKYRVDVPASPTLYRLATDNVADDVTAGVTSILTAEADSTALLATGVNGVLRLSGVLSNGSTAGQVIFQFAQNTQTASQSAIIRAGSHFEYRYF